VLVQSSHRRLTSEVAQVEDHHGQDRDEQDRCERGCAPVVEELEHLLEHANGDDVVVVWPTNRISQMHASLERFVTDLTTGRLTHDGCEITARHISNARKLLRPGEKYIIGKPQGAYHQKIDAAVTSVLAHEAACDARAAGWTVKKKSYIYTD